MKGCEAHLRKAGADGRQCCKVEGKPHNRWGWSFGLSSSKDPRYVIKYFKPFDTLGAKLFVISQARAKDGVKFDGASVIDGHGKA